MIDYLSSIHFYWAVWPLPVVGWILDLHMQLLSASPPQLTFRDETVVKWAFRIFLCLQMVEWRRPCLVTTQTATDRPRRVAAHRRWPSRRRHRWRWRPTTNAALAPPSAPVAPLPPVRTPDVPVGCRMWVEVRWFAFLWNVFVPENVVYIDGPRTTLKSGVRILFGNFRIKRYSFVINSDNWRRASV